MKLIPLPAFSDNYIWLLQRGHKALVVDPGDAQPVLDFLQAHALQLEGILITHHHADHTGGVERLRASTEAAVYGPATEVMPEPVQRLRGGQSVDLLGLNFLVLDVPGHTAGHIAYMCDDFDGAPILFCGDTLSAEVAAACLKVRPHKCSHHCSNWPRYRTLHWCVAPTNTLCPT